MAQEISRRHFLSTGGRATLLGLTAGGLGSFLAGCSSDPSVNNSVAGPSTLEPTGTGATKQQLNLLLGSHMDPVQTLLTEYAADTGNIDTSVEEVTTPDLRAKTSTPFLSGQSPWNMIFLTAELAAQYGDNGWLDPVDDFIESEVKETGSLMERGVGAAKIGGQTYGVPWTMGCPILHWNKAMMDAVGLDPETPQEWHSRQNSWDEFVEFAVELTGERDGVQYYGYTDAWAGTYILWTWGSLLQMHGGRFLDEDMNPIMNSAAGVAATEKMLDLLYVHKCIDPAVRTYTFAPDASPGFLGGTRGMFISWPHFAGLANNPEQSDIVGDNGFAPNPAVDTSASVDGSEYLAIPAFSSADDASYGFLRHVTSIEGQRQIARAGWGAIYAEVLKEKEVLDAFPYYEAIRKAYQYPVDGGWSPDRPMWADILAVELSEALDRAKTPKQALDDAVAQINAERGT